VEYAERQPDIYVLPLAWATGARAVDLQREQADLVIAQVTVAARTGAVDGIVYDAIGEPRCAVALLKVAVENRRLKGTHGHVTALRTPAFRSAKASRAMAASMHVIAEEQSNSTLAYGEIAVLKLFRKVDAGLHPDFAIGDFLTRHQFRHAPTVVGALQYQRPRREPIVLTLLQRFVPNDGDAWQYTLQMLKRYGREVRGRPEPALAGSCSARALLVATEGSLPPLAEEHLAAYLPAARRLGQRTGELHRVLGAAAGHPHLAPEPFSRLYQRSAYQSLRGLTCSVIDALRDERPKLPEVLIPDADRVIAAQGQLLDRFSGILRRRISATRIACHGNYHLQQVLRTEGDFTIIDFEGEPSRPLFERRLKRSPLVDIVSMVRSFHYAARIVLPDEQRGSEPDGSHPGRGWSLFWRHWVSVAFLQTYFATADRDLLPRDPDDLHLLLDVQLLERTLYELGNELTHRPDWVHIPLSDLKDLLEAS